MSLHRGHVSARHDDGRLPAQVVQSRRILEEPVVAILPHVTVPSQVEASSKVLFKYVRARHNCQTPMMRLTGGHGTSISASIDAVPGRSQDRLSVVVTTYRRPDDLTQCLEALTRQDRRPDEVIVVIRDTDQASHDVVRRYGDLWLRVVAPTAPGVVPAISAGLMAAVGDGVAIVDDDARPECDWLKRVERALRQPGVVAVGGRNQTYISGRPEHHRSRRVGVLGWQGHLVGMHYARTEVRGRAVDHLQGCNMAFAAPWPLPDLALRGAGVYYELDMCLTARRRGVIWYDERILVHHHLGQRPSDETEDPAAGVVQSRSARNEDMVAAASYNYAYVLAKHTTRPVQRAIRLSYIMLVGQRLTWGVARAMAEIVRGRETRHMVRLLRVALRSKQAGWQAGTSTQRSG